jgi:hypothetical protein
MSLIPSTTHNTNIHAPGGFLFCSIFFVLIPLLFTFCPYCKTHTTQISMLSAGFEPASPANERPQTLALDRTATEIGRIRTRNPS